MPVQFRTFYLKKLTNVKEREKAEYEKAAGKNEGQSQQQIVKGPGVRPR